MKLIRAFFTVITYLVNLPLLVLAKIAPFSLKVNGILLILNQGTIKIGKGGKINSSPLRNIIGGDTRSTIIIKNGAVLTIGENFKMSNSAIYCAEKISIGDNVMIGGSCRIWDTDFHPLNPAERAENPNTGYITRPISIGDNVFIGGFSILLKGSTIGNGSIIGAGSIVSGTIPEGEIWAGNPARFIKKVSK